MECETSAGPSRGGKDQRGAAIAEFALVLPLLIMILLGIIEFGIVFNRSQSIEAAARNGGRLASISTSEEAEIDAAVTQALGFTPADIAVTPDVCRDREGDSITVTVTHPHTIDIPFAGPWNITLTGTGVYRCEA